MPDSLKLPFLRWLLLLVFVAFLAGALAGGLISYLLNDDYDAGSVTSSSLQSSGRKPPSGDGDDPIAAAAQFALPAVVTVVNQLPPRQDGQGRIFEGTSVGSGVIVDTRGFIVTNEHVIHEQGTLSIVLENGDQRPATLVSHDAPFTDIAVLRIAPGGLTALPLGNSDDIATGEGVIAIGSALFEYRNSVTRGIVSGLHRRWLRQGVYMEDLIQTDAAINTGNSGGPLINLRGEVVGINTNVVRSLGTNENVHGIAFAISSKTIAPIAQAIIERGFYPRPYFGIDHQNIDDELRGTTALPVPDGAIVRRVFAESPASRAGLRVGDVLLRLGQTPITDDVPFINALARLGVNETVNVDLWREGRTLSVSLALVPR